MKINDRAIGNKLPPNVVAEISGNHNRTLGRARDVTAKAACTDATPVKLRTYRPDTNKRNSDSEGFMIIGGQWNVRPLLDLHAGEILLWE